MAGLSQITAPDLCREDACFRPTHAHQRCTKHYQRWYKRRLPMCSVEGCEKRVLSISWDYCGRHYYRSQRRDGNPGCPGVEVDNQGTLEERFWRKVDKREPDECWPWKGPFHPAGYGSFGHNSLGAHRVAYILTHGPIDDKRICVHHRCGDITCCNPAHLELATRRENTLEMHERKALRAEIENLRAENASLRARLSDCEAKA